MHSFGSQIVKQGFDGTNLFHRVHGHMYEFDVHFVNRSEVCLDLDDGVETTAQGHYVTVLRNQKLRRFIYVTIRIW